MTLESSVAADGAGAKRRTFGAVRLNNIAELRLLFAACVVLSHAVQLSGATAFDMIRFVMNSEVAVQGFFILSGYLVFGSYDRIRDTRLFYRRRLARIYPAYLAAVLVFLAMGLAQALVLGRGVVWADVPLYLAANLATLNFLYPTVQGVFADNPLAHINGALWSIKVELMFYALVPILYWASRRASVAWLAVALIVAGALWWPVLTWLGDRVGMAVPLSFKYQVTGQLHFFGLGIALFARSKGDLSTAGLAAIVAFTLVILAVVGAPRDAVHALGLVLVIGLVSALPQMNNPFHKQDISFGIYLSHFPLIQLLLAGGAGAWPFLVYVSVLIVLAVGYGLLSWNWIERPALASGERKRA